MPRPSKESPQALQAYHDYADMGPGRSMDGLLNLYRSYTDRTPPTKHIATLKTWSVAFNWQDRLINRETQIADRAEAKVAQEREEYKRQRLQEARALRSAGAAVLKRMLERVGELDSMNLVGRIVYPDKGKPYRLDGILDVLPTALRAIEIGHKEERLELGEATERVNHEFSNLSDEELIDRAKAALGGVVLPKD